MKRRVETTRGATAAMAFAALAGVCLGAGDVEEPVLEGIKVQVETYGDAANVKLLADLLDDADALVREEAVRGLGQTHNARALPHIRRAMKDPSPAVRAAGALAAADLDPARAGPIVAGALADKAKPVVFAALLCARRLRLTSAAAKIQPLLHAPSRQLQAVALRTLTHLGRAAPAERLRSLLDSPSVLVRLRAAENAGHLTAAAGVVGRLLQMAREDAPAVRGAALAALGRWAFDKARPLLAKVAADSPVEVRRGAVLAWRGGRQADRIRGFLDDASAAVRLEAIRAAGELKAGDCTERLLELLLAARDEQSRGAARESLRSIGSAAVIAGAARAVRQTHTRLVEARKKLAQSPELREQVRHLEKAVGACCRLLGELRAKEGVAPVAAVVKVEPTDSPLLADAAEALGMIGDKGAAAAVAGRLADCVPLGRAHLQAMMSPTPPYVPFREEITGQLALALGRLGASASAATLVKLATTGVQTLRLEWSAACAARALTDVATPANRADVERTILGMLADEHYGLTVRFELAKAAGRLKLAKAAPALEKVLNQDRPCRPVMRAAAWALKQITGALPPIPAPRVKQGNWIIRRLKP